ncbi:glutathione S-transferase family protein [Ferrimonas balearica]|uniref:glutathione S-transferase family protein n=1 Tax=Ferrimonas balearica TaxID=44012 RepID=UPI001C9966E2|nr:glutathione S-transferase [Ferrimonas balearica]MBY5991012.1 glutathione S-transferase [Ferrimonas balearica]
MKLYETAATPNAKRVNLFLAELGIEVPRVAMDVRAGDNLTPEFRAKSLNGKIPLLELDDGTTVCESVAICRYFDGQRGDHPSLFGTTALEQAQVEMWQRLVELEGLMVAFQAFRNISGVYADRERCVEAWGHESRRRLEEFLPTLEARLGESPYLAGPEFSIADITAYVLLGMAARLEIAVDTPHLNAFRARVQARPAVQQVEGAI